MFGRHVAGVFIKLAHKRDLFVIEILDGLGQRLFKVDEKRRHRKSFAHQTRIFEHRIAPQLAFKLVAMCDVLARLLDGRKKRRGAGGMENRNGTFESQHIVGQRVFDNAIGKVRQGVG